MEYEEKDFKFWKKYAEQVKISEEKELSYLKKIDELNSGIFKVKKDEL